MKPITYVICSAGRGERFRKFGLNMPKPLIKLQGRTMLERALESLNYTSQDQVLIVTQKSDRLPEQFNFPKQIEWIEIDGDTRGQLHTYLIVSPHVRHSSVVIYNCDTYFKTSQLTSVLESEKYEGIIPCASVPGDSWSFCKVDHQFNVTEVAEKKRISEWASVGYYYFRNKDLLHRLAEEEMQAVQNKEVYVAPLYNRYLNEGYPLKVVPTDIFLPFGTFEQVKDYWGISAEDLLKENS